MNQNQLAQLFGTSKQNISNHIINILKDKELVEDSVVKYYLTTDFWRQNIDAILQLNDKAILTHKGKISNAVMEAKVKEIYAKFDENRKAQEAQLADELDLKALEDLNKDLKDRQ